MIDKILLKMNRLAVYSYLTRYHYHDNDDDNVHNSAVIKEQGIMYKRGQSNAADRKAGRQAGPLSLDLTSWL